MADRSLRFVQAQHKHFNRLLNFEVQETRTTPIPIHYTHAYEDDIFRMAGTKKVRVRRDQKTRAVVQVCEKVRLGDLNIFCPMSKFDWRLSISTEKPCECWRRLDTVRIRHMADPSAWQQYRPSRQDLISMCARRTASRISTRLFKLI